MLSPSLSDRPSSTDRRPRPLGGTAQAGALAAITVAVTAVAFVASPLVLPHPLALLGAGIVVIAALGGATVWLVHRDALRLRAAEDWHRRLRRELIVQSAFLDGLVGSLGTMSSIADPARALERAAEEAHRLVRPDATVLLVPGADGRGLRPAVARGIALGPIADLVVELDAEVTRAPVAGRTGTDALSRRLRPTATVTVPIAAMDELRGLLVLMRESERAELSRRVVSDEQDERRKLSLFLHDGPLQTMSGIAMMLDAVAEDTASGDVESALRVLDAARERQRGVVRSVRELSFALEPWVLRDRGFVAAVTALADEVERSHRVAIDLDVEAAADLSPDDQVFLYQIVREAVQNAVKHASPERVAVAVIGSRDRGFDVHVRDDGAGFAGGPEDDLPHHGLASMRERAQILGGRLRVSSIPGTGTTVQLSIPADAPDAA